MTENRAKEGATEMKRLKKNTGWSKWISLTLIVLLAAAILAGCGSADQGAESGAEDGVTAYVGGTIFESSLDPVKGGMAYGYSFINSALTKVSPESEYVGDLAKDWEINDDARTYTFKLRQDVKFHDGSDFTAEDVVFTYNTVKENQGDNANVDLSRLESVTARGDDTVVFTLKEPYSSFLDQTVMTAKPLIQCRWEPAPGKSCSMTRSRRSLSPQTKAITKERRKFPR